MKYLLAALIGGLIVAVATKALPRMMANMMAEMQKQGHDPAEM